VSSGSCQVQRNNQDAHDYGYKLKPIYDIFETGEWTGAIGCV